MRRNQLSFVNHASFIVENDSALLLVDPWLEGPAFNNGWSLLDQSTSSEALVGRLNRSGLPMFIWFSHEHPDRLSLSFLRKFREQFRGIATFLYRQTRDKRVPGFLRKNGFDVRECAPGAPMVLGQDMRITVHPCGDGHSWCLVESGGRSVLNLNDCPLVTAKQCRAVKDRVSAAAPRVDYLFTQFGYGGWVGNPGQAAEHRGAARAQVRRMAVQLACLRPRVTVPFASFFYFSSEDNAYLNESQNTAGEIVLAPELARWAPGIRLLRPGSVVDLETDSAASLTREHEGALAHWHSLLAQRSKRLPSPPPVALAEIRSAFARYRALLDRSLRGMPRLLEALGRIRPLVLYLPDLKLTVELSYRHGWKVLPAEAPHHVSLASGDALFLFKNDYGYDTAQANGRFRVTRPPAFRVFKRFFLPQRLARAGCDRKRPLAMARYLAGDALARAGRELQAKLGLSG